MNLPCWVLAGLVYALSPAIANAAKQDLVVPFQFGLGKSLFEENCAGCHGVWGGGSNKAPSLMNKLYVPAHHGDEAFYRAALKGIRSHHWQFGDMPPVPGISKRALDKIVPYVRWLQRENELD